MILTDNKTRDAYDSLLSVRKSNYMSPEETQSVTHPSYLANRKLSKLISIYQDRKNWRKKLILMSLEGIREVFHKEEEISEDVPWGKQGRCIDKLNLKINSIDTLNTTWLLKKRLNLSRISTKMNERQGLWNGPGFLSKLTTTTLLSEHSDLDTGPRSNFSLSSSTSFLHSTT